MKGGVRAEEVGKIVALPAVEPAPDYVIELPEGRSERAIQSEAERAA